MGRYILGISAFYHNSAAAIVVDGQVIAAVEEERFTRKKNTAVWPENAINWCLKFAGIKSYQLNMIAFYERPFTKFKRQIDFSVKNNPFRNNSCIKSLHNLRCLYSRLEALNISKEKIVFIPHHSSHAAYSFYTSPFEEAVIIVVDGVGEDSCTTIYSGYSKKIRLLESIYYPNSLGLFYSAMTSYLGFRPLSDEYKVMGLAAYGNNEYFNLVNNLIKINSTGTYKINNQYFNFDNNSLPMYTSKLSQELGDPRKPNEDITERHASIAFATQKVLSNTFSNIVKQGNHLLPKIKNVCVGGGVALNCKAIQNISKLSYINKVYVPPGPGDAGAAIGAALLASIEFGQDLERNEVFDPYIGPESTENGIRNIEKLLSGFEKIESDSRNNELITKKITEGKIIGICVGRSEFGPRALGNRSIIADPRNPVISKKINALIKHREMFRPFAPAILEEKMNNLISSGNPDRYMQSTVDISKEWREKLPAVTHVDGTARVQVVDKKINPRFHEIITAFYKKTGVPAVLNTSFNHSSEPIVNNDLQAALTTLRCQIDYLVCENGIYKNLRATCKS